MNDAELIWNFLNVRVDVTPADCILVLCSHDIRTAQYAAELFLAGKGKTLIFSGGVNSFTKNIYTKTEAEAFAEVAIKAGVPAHRIIVENKSTNTAENFQLTIALLRSLSLEFHSYILVQVPNMLRRVRATGQKYLMNYQVTTHPISFSEAPHAHLTLEMLLHEISGDLQRLQVYPKMGFHHEIEIPESVMDAWHRLVNAGYTGNFVSNIDT
jgi:uncharacterized SAM-binding protein YcdF (DUF218 family)